MEVSLACRFDLNPNILLKTYISASRSHKPNNNNTITSFSQLCSESANETLTFLRQAHSMPLRTFTSVKDVKGGGNRHKED